MPLALPLAGGRAADPLTTAGPLAAFVLLPTMLGMAVRRRAPAAAASLRPVLDAAAGGIGVTCLALVGVRYGSDIAPWSAGVAILTQLVFLAVVAAAAYGLGAGLDARQRVALTIGACTRNLGAALAPLVAAGSDQRPIVMLALAVPATIAVGVAAALWFSAGAEPRRPLSPAG
jgi:BASS family bile acid:Na+ symporter